MTLSEGLNLANQQNVDLIQISISQGQAICILESHQRYLYRKKKEEKEKQQKPPEMKEIRFSLNTDENDILHKCKNAKKFIEGNHKVKLSIPLHGREIAFKNMAMDKLNHIYECMSDVCKIEISPKLDGKIAYMILSKKG